MRFHRITFLYFLKVGVSAYFLKIKLLFYTK